MVCVCVRIKDLILQMNVIYVFQLDICLILQVVIARHCDEVREVIQRLGHLREGGPALYAWQAGACPLLDTLDVFLKNFYSSIYLELVSR